jgi:hypothetical protein
MKLLCLLLVLQVVHLQPSGVKVKKPTVTKAYPDWRLKNLPYRPIRRSTITPSHAG